MENTKTIAVKGMVCDRCKMVVTKAMNNLGLEVREVHLGSITLAGMAKLESMDPIRQTLKDNGFELLNDRQTIVVSETKRIIDEILNQNQEYDVRLKFSRLLSEKFHMNYDTISTLFSTIEGLTLEKYIINKRLEKVKELLVYTDFTLTEIAYLTGFSSIQHLSNQFKELTELSPSHFREVKARKENLS
jgi:AraC-like DNA-binding protein